MSFRNPELEQMSNYDFAAYLEQVRDDLAQEGMESLAEDLHEAAKRISDIPYMEQEAYSLGQLDLVNSGEYRRAGS